LIQQSRECGVLFVPTADEHVKLVENEHNGIEILVDDPKEFVPLLFRRDPVFRHLKIPVRLLSRLLCEFIDGDTQSVAVLAVDLNCSEAYISRLTDPTDVLTDSVRVYPVGSTAGTA